MYLKTYFYIFFLEFIYKLETNFMLSCPLFGMTLKLGGFRTPNTALLVQVLVHTAPWTYTKNINLYNWFYPTSADGNGNRNDMCILDISTPEPAGLIWYLSIQSSVWVWWKESMRVREVKGRIEGRREVKR